MAGIYIHIPFCKQKCHYCNFYSLASVKYRDVFVDILLKEIELQKDYLSGETIETIYFGGGTPSLLSVGEIKRIIDELAVFHNINNNAEITLEANPDDINPKKVAGLRQTPINRFSIGVQSFFDDELQYLHRIHSGQDAEISVRTVKDAGFTNLSIDLIYGNPVMRDEKWKLNIEKFFDLEIPHLSAYALTVEPKTALDVLIRKGKMKNVDDNTAANHFMILTEKMKEQGFIHYEISNFSKKGFHSEHNTSYWQGKKYLGLGPSAHSFDGDSRQWNVSNLSKYIEGVKNGGIIVEKETLTTEQKYNEYVMTSLRTIWGTDLKYIRDSFGEGFENHYLKKTRPHLQMGNVLRENDIFKLTESGKLFADGITSDLFF